MQLKYHGSAPFSYIVTGANTMKLSLSELGIGQSAVVTGVDTDDTLKNRLYDIGLVKNTPVKVLHASPAGDPRAYFIRGAVIALRLADTNHITVETESVSNG